MPYCVEVDATDPRRHPVKRNPWRDHHVPRFHRPLSPQERLALIADLWDSLGEEDGPLTPEQRAELDRRMAVPDDERSDTVDWSALRDELFRRLG